MKTINNINLNEVKNILDNATWHYEYCGDLGSDTEKALYYLDSQKFSISKIEEFIHIIEGEDLATPKEVAISIADSIARDRIRKYIWSEKNKGDDKWAISDSTSFKIY